MPSNKELKAQAIELAAELKLDVVTEGLNNAKLAELVSDLKAKKTDADTPTGADAAEKDAAEKDAAEKDAAEKEAAEKEAAEKEAAEKEAAEKEAAEKEAAAATRKKGKVYVAEGKALTTKRGILGPGEEITAEDLSTGKEGIAYFIKSGHLEKA